MDLTVEHAALAEKPALRRLMEFYRYDFSDFERSDVDADGLFGYRYLDDYWVDSDRHPFVFRVDGALAGFALVREVEPTEMAEFFVMRRYRRLGVGSRAAVSILRSFPGPWRLTQVPDNPAATTFWRRAIPTPYTEQVLPDGKTEQRLTIE